MSTLSRNVVRYMLKASIGHAHACCARVAVAIYYRIGNLANKRFEVFLFIALLCQLFHLLKYFWDKLGIYKKFVYSY